MAEGTIVGVDFSGAKTEGKTWVTKGFLEMEGSFDAEKGSLLLLSCKSVSREDLTKLLKALPNNAVAALDFPFSVPIAFAEHLGHPGSEMPTLWQSAFDMKKIDEFEGSAEGFKQLLRVGDLHCSNAKPCLKPKGNPVMVKMTFSGMQMLHSLRQAGCRVPPLDDDECNGATLLEVMPREALRAFGLRDQGFKNGQNALENRREILRKLPEISNVKLTNLSAFRDECMFSDDALDSIVAAVVAALWSMDESESTFKRPSKGRTVADARAKYRRKPTISSGIEQLTEIEAARKEGWIYVPRIVKK